MALSIKDEETDVLVRKLARMVNVSYTVAIKLAVANEIAKREAPARNPARIQEAARAIQREFQSLKSADPRTADEIIGYDEFGLPR
jgi:antitoxin VapB